LSESQIFADFSYFTDFGFVQQITICEIIIMTIICDSDSFCVRDWKGLARRRRAGAQRSPGKPGPQGNAQLMPESEFSEFENFQNQINAHPVNPLMP
jgi:hypothetical protein